MIHVPVGDNEDVPDRIVGLDLSLTSTGICFGSDEFEALSTKLKGTERLEFYEWEIRNRLNGNDYVVLEDYAYAKRGTHAYSLGELGGVIKLSLYDRKISLTVVAPTARAKFATGRGNASKSEVVSAVSARTGIEFKGPGADDMVDAFVLREMGLHAFGIGEFDWPKQNLSVLEKVNWTGWML